MINYISMLIPAASLKISCKKDAMVKKNKFLASRTAEEAARMGLVTDYFKRAKYSDKVVKKMLDLDDDEDGVIETVHAYKESSKMMGLFAENALLQKGFRKYDYYSKKQRILFVYARHLADNTDKERANQTGVPLKDQRLKAHAFRGPFITVEQETVSPDAFSQMHFMQEIFKMGYHESGLDRLTAHGQHAVIKTQPIEGFRQQSKTTVFVVRSVSLLKTLLGSMYARSFDNAASLGAISQAEPPFIIKYNENQFKVSLSWKLKASRNGIAVRQRRGWGGRIIATTV